MSLAAILAGASAGQQILGTVGSLMAPKPKFPKIDRGGLRSLASARLATQNAQTQANIKQAGAAGRLPSGAITSALALAGSRAPGVDAGIDRLDIGVQEFNAGQESRASMAGQQRYEDLINLNLTGLGTLSKIAILSKYGYLGGGGNQDVDPSMIGGY